ncbi:complement C1q domain-containing protein [Dyadobacter sp. CY323]|uniref:complement C1q domain-containing protein n=1 Tax=Dyadobacter sp. CY323 TaxID=2907302 RepID=UPI001F456866|nr:complement C1q domain-containing protein [Dyadobacter sp. CY323]MCE6991760.1 complement C1q domain-containing protein [Dyadobacter sp. CY323]
MKKQLLLFATFFIQQGLFAQGVGINTTTPHASAALDIRSPNGLNKGVMLPNVDLQSLSDKTTIPSPAVGLLIWNSNSSLTGGIGVYQWNGAAVGTWKNISNQFSIPFTSALSINATHFQIENYSNSSASTAIKAYSGGPGTGVSTFSSTGLALDVSGGVKIAGNGQSPGVGKVLTSDANGNATWEGAVAFKASGVKGSGSEKVALGVDSKIPFNIEDYDLGGNYTDANSSPHSTFTAPVTGIYHFDVTVGFTVPNDINVDSRLALKTIRNGSTTTIAQSYYLTGASLDGKHDISIDVLLQQNDQVFATVTQYSVDYLSLYKEEHLSHFNGRLIMKQ